MRRLLLIISAVVAVVFVFGQFHRPHDETRPINPADTMDAQLHPNDQVRNMLHQSCYNCHSEEGEHPWYSHVWPASALIQNDVREGRARLDFSEWDRLSPEMSRIRLLDSCTMMRESKMPLWYYRPLHPGTATPRSEDVDAFCKWVDGLPTGRDTASVR